jgi:hypothetical protein
MGVWSRERPQPMACVTARTAMAMRLRLLVVPLLVGASLDRGIFIEALRSADVASCVRNHELPPRRWVVRVATAVIEMPSTVPLTDADCGAEA